MKLKIFIGLTIVAFFSVSAFSQEPATSKPSARLRVIEANATATPTPRPGKVVVITDNTPKASPTPKPTPYRIPEPKVPTPETNQTVPTNPQNSANRLSFGQIRSKINEAKREMQSRPILTAS